MTEETAVRRTKINPQTIRVERSKDEIPKQADSFFGKLEMGPSLWRLGGEDRGSWIQDVTGAVGDDPCSSMTVGHGNVDQSGRQLHSTLINIDSNHNDGYGVWV